MLVDVTRRRLERLASASSVQAMRINVQVLGGDATAFEVEASDTVGNLKMRVWDVKGVPAAEQRLLHCGKQLEDGRLLSDYNLCHDVIIYMARRLRPDNVGKDPRRRRRPAPLIRAFASTASAVDIDVDVPRVASKSGAAARPSSTDVPPTPRSLEELARHAPKELTSSCCADPVSPCSPCGTRLGGC